MPTNMKKSAVATGLEKVSFHSNPKERQCQRMLKLPHNCTHLTRQQSNAQNSPSQASTIREPSTSRCSSWIQKKRNQGNQTANIHWIIEKARQFQKNITISASLTMLKPLTVWITTNWKTLQEMGIPDHLTCLLGNLYAGQVRNRHETANWFQNGKGVHQGCISSPCLLNFYAEYIMRNAGLDEAKLASRLWGEISITSNMQMIPPLWHKVKRN